MLKQLEVETWKAHKLSNFNQFESEKLQEFGRKHFQNLFSIILFKNYCFIR